MGVRAGEPPDCDRDPWTKVARGVYVAACDHEDHRGA